MTKFRVEERISAALAFEAGDSLAEVGKRFGMSRQVVRRSVALYRTHGSEGFKTHKYNWTGEEKLQVLNYQQTHHLSYEETGIKFGITGTSIVQEWERRYLENGSSGLEPKKKGRRPKSQKPKPALTQLEQLLAENEYLRAENEYLKKLNALVAEREAREKRDKTTE